MASSTKTKGLETKTVESEGSAKDRLIQESLAKAGSAELGDGLKKKGRH